MDLKKYAPSDILKPFVRYYFVFESNAETAFQDTVFPSGDMEMIFNLGNGVWESAVDESFQQTPITELWGQITQPLLIRSKGKHSMLGVRLFPHGAISFLHSEVNIFNDRVADLSEVVGNSVKELHNRLLETGNIDLRIQLIEQFLLQRLNTKRRQSSNIDKVSHILSTLKKDPQENNISDVASMFGITTRYLHKLVYEHTGLSPKLFNKINRFQQSLLLIAKNNQPLTAIAYDCGYFDQSHFIREFKSFTGVTPSAYAEKQFMMTQAFQQ